MGIDFIPGRVTRDRGCSGDVGDGAMAAVQLWSLSTMISSGKI